MACNFFNSRWANGVISSCRNYGRRRQRGRESQILCMRVYNFTTAFRRDATAKFHAVISLRPANKGARLGRTLYVRSRSVVYTRAHARDSPGCSETNISSPKNANLTATEIRRNYRNCRCPNKSLENDKNKTMRRVINISRVYVIAEMLLQFYYG